MTGVIHLTTAYSVFFLGLLLYVHSLVKRRKKVEQEIGELKKIT